MFTWPIELVPNRVNPLALPEKARAEGTPNEGIVDRSILLGDIPQRGTLELVFENYRVKRREIPNTPNHDPNQTGACGETEGGWVGVWEFWHKTEYGHLSFEIPSTHPLWDRIDFKEPWLAHGLDGLPAIYRIIEPPKPTMPGFKGQSNFSVIIRQHIRTPRHT